MMMYVLQTREEIRREGRKEAHRTQNHDLWSGQTDIYLYIYDLLKLLIDDENKYVVVYLYICSYAAS